MKKAALSLYILMVAGCLACLQSAGSFTEVSLTDCPSAVTILKPAGIIPANKNTVWVLPAGAGKIYSGYTINMAGLYAMPVYSSSIYYNALRVCAGSGLAKKQLILF